MKCCKNCFWSFTEEDEKEVEGYNDDDPNKPQAGDCCLGRDHGGAYYCSSHSFIDGMEEYENYVIYDEEYFGPGYIIVSKLNDKIIKFLKIVKVGEGGFPQFYIRAYEKDSKDNPNDIFRDIEIKAYEEEPLYSVIKTLDKNLNKNRVFTIDSYNQGKNNISSNSGLYNTTITISKDIYGVKNATDFIDVFIGDNDTCEYYYAIYTFYNDLSKIATKNKDDIKKLLLI